VHDRRRDCCGCNSAKDISPAHQHEHVEGEHVPERNCDHVRGAEADHAG
jgi:hypothetical protein